MSEPATLSNTTSAFRPLTTTTALRPARLQCPQCSIASDKSSLIPCMIDGVEFHHCVGCGGAWFYEKDSDVAMRAAGSQTWPEPRQLSDLKSVAAHAWECPCCAGSLVEIRDRRGSGATVRRCLVCYGGWMDHDDLKCVTAASSHLMARFSRMIRKTFSL